MNLMGFILRAIRPEPQIYWVPGRKSFLLDPKGYHEVINCTVFISFSLSAKISSIEAFEDLGAIFEQISNLVEDTFLDAMQFQHYLA